MIEKLLVEGLIQAIIDKRVEILSGLGLLFYLFLDYQLHKRGRKSFIGFVKFVMAKVKRAE